MHANLLIVIVLTAIIIRSSLSNLIIIVHEVILTTKTSDGVWSPKATINITYTYIIDKLLLKKATYLSMIQGAHQKPFSLSRDNDSYM